MTGDSVEPLVRIAELTIDPKQIDAYRKLLREEIDASLRLEPGVLFLHAVSIKGQPEQIRVVECYADRAAYDAHLETPHFLKYKAETAAMVLSLRLLETDPIILRTNAEFRQAALSAGPDSA